MCDYFLKNNLTRYKIKSRIKFVKRKEFFFRHLVTYKDTKLIKYSLFSPKPLKCIKNKNIIAKKKFFLIIEYLLKLQKLTIKKGGKYER